MATKKRSNRKIKLTPWDPVEHLKTEEDIALYLEAAMEEAGDDASYIAAVLGDIARARGIMALAEQTGMTRMGLYKALRKGGNPSLATVVKVAKVLGLKLALHKAA